MKISELKESIQGESFDVYFSDYGFNINLNTRKIHEISKSDTDNIFRRLSEFDDEDAMKIERIYDKFVKELEKETEIEIAEITDSFTTILQALLIEYKTKKENKLKELKDDFKRKR